MCYKRDKIERFDSLSSRSLSLRPARLCRSFPSYSILDPVEFTLSERSEPNGLEMTECAIGVETSAALARN